MKLIAAYLVIGLCCASGAAIFGMTVLYAMDGHPLGIAAVAVVIIILIWESHRWATKTIRSSRRPETRPFADIVSEAFSLKVGETIRFRRPTQYNKEEPDRECPITSKPCDSGCIGPQRTGKVGLICPQFCQHCLMSPFPNNCLIANCPTKGSNH